MKSYKLKSIICFLKRGHEYTVREDLSYTPQMEECVDCGKQVAMWIDKRGVLKIDAGGDFFG